MGEYDYRVTAMRVGRSGLEIDGSLGMWDTTMVVEPKDLALPAAVLATLAALALVVGRRL